MILSKHNQSGIKIATISSLLFAAQLIFFTQVMPAYAAPPSGWDQAGAIVPDASLPDVKHQPHAKALSENLNIPILRQHGQDSTKGGSSEVLATTTGTKTVVGTGSVSGLGYDSVTPPDVQVAAGPTNVMEMVNLQGAVWTKAGALQSGPFSLATFFGTGTHSISDPKVLYDSQSARWFVSITDISASSVRVAVSRTSDATGSYCIYNIAGSSSYLLDQPIIGVSSDKFVISANDFNKYSGQFGQAQYWVLNKAQMLSCLSASYVTKGTNSYFSIHPVQSLTSTSTEYMVSTLASSTGSTLNVFAISGVPSGAVSVSTYSLPTSTISSPPAAVQRGTTYTLETGDYRVQDAVWANGKLWVAFNNKCTPAGDTAARSCIHLVDINTSTIVVVQDFNYGVTGKYVFYPAIRVIPSTGNVFVVFGLSSASNYPSIEVTEHASTDPVNSLEAPTLLQAGNGPVTLTFGCSGGVCRYGDYFGAGLDPSVSNGVWVAGEYGTGVNSAYGPTWGTRIASFTG